MGKLQYKNAKNNKKKKKTSRKQCHLPFEVYKSSWRDNSIHAPRSRNVMAKTIIIAATAILESINRDRLVVLYFLFSVGCNFQRTSLNWKGLNITVNVKAVLVVGSSMIKLIS